jgi:hypothetical protein
LEDIILPIEQLDIEKNFLRIDAPFNSYTFLIRPKTIYDLFEKYGFKLFFSNIRNPLIASEYNKQIEQTMRDAPDFFWYYNNGVTAITRDLPRRVNATAQQIKVTGFQIINGAQTVYSVYKAYKEAKNGKRNTINTALLQLRLVQSVNREFDLDITRYTNQQNPTEPRDFWANDPVQIRLQNESFATNYWYSIRRGEFREVPENVKVVSNEDFIHIYAKFINDGIGKSSIWVSVKEADALGISFGEYEKYFNDNLKFEQLLVAYRLYEEEILLFDGIVRYSESRFDFHSKDIEPYPKNSLSDMSVILTRLYDKNLYTRTLSKLNKNDGFIFKIIAFIIQIRKDFSKNLEVESGYTLFDMNTILKEMKIEPTEDTIEKIDWKAYFGIS